MRYFLALLVVIGFASCENYFGKKSDLSFIDKPVYQPIEVAYVPIQPILSGFIYPTDVVAGYDELVYIVDNGSEEIISIDQSGVELGRFSVPGVKKLTQDRKLELLAIGTFDTTIKKINYTLSCIYRINQQSEDGYGLEHAKITKKIIHPFYYKPSFSSTDQQVEFTSIAPMADNRYYVSRNGPGSNFLGSNQAVILFNRKDEMISPINVTAQSGEFFNDYFKAPASLITRSQPPQISASQEENFIYVSQDSETSIKVQLISKSEDDFGVAYVPESTVIGDKTQADDFLQRPGRFRNPEDVTVTGDGTNYIFIVDSESDSLYQFTFNGLEGIKPPAGSDQTKYIKASFGGLGENASQFNDPMGVAYLDQIVYVADAGNQRVLRFKLTLDFD